MYIDKTVVGQLVELGGMRTKDVAWRDIIRARGDHMDARLGQSGRTDGVSLHLLYMDRDGRYRPPRYSARIGFEQRRSGGKALVPRERGPHAVSNALEIAAHFPRILAGDCGKTNLVAIVERLADGSEKRYVLTRGQYQRQIRWAERHTEATKRLAAITDERAGITRRTADPTKLAAFQRVMAAQQQRLLGDAGELWSWWWANDRFWARAAKESSLKRFFARVLRGVPRSVRASGATAAESALLVLGDSVIPSTFGGVTSPTIAVVRAAVGVFGVDRVRFQDEFRTTKTHAACGQVLDKCRALVTDARWQRSDVPGAGMGRGRAKRYLPGDVIDVRGLLRCPCCGIFVDRDVNAAWNIRAGFTLRLAAAAALEVWGAGDRPDDAPGCAASDRPATRMEHLRRTGGKRPGERQGVFRVLESAGSAG